MFNLMMYMVSLLAHSNQFLCMIYWLETSQGEVRLFGKQLFSELEWMKSLVEHRHQILSWFVACHALFSIWDAQGTFSGHLTYQLYFRNYWFGACWWSLDTEESSYWITYRLMTHQMLKAKSLKCTSELNHSIVGNEEFITSLNLIQ